jgi:hypothetical protein
VNTATRLWTGRSWVRIPAGERYCSLLQTVHAGFVAHPASCSVGAEVFFPGVKRPGQEVDHSPPSSAKVKNEWSCTTAPPVCLLGVGRDKYTFPLPNRRLIMLFEIVDYIFVQVSHDVWIPFHLRGL